MYHLCLCWQVLAACGLVSYSAVQLPVTGHSAGTDEESFTIFLLCGAGAGMALQGAQPWILLSALSGLGSEHLEGGKLLTDAL